ncbi:MAG TPA: hypothetical protein VFN42_13745, partial [Acetobacteraceae bacterium]|nr:hypothetical protein [Acetobacteraceae bacterium]
MAKIVLGLATSHGPLLTTPPEQWDERAKADRANTQLWFRGAVHSFDALQAMRAGEGLEDKTSPEERRARSIRCRQALDRLATLFEQARPDAVVIVGNDQQEVFGFGNMPAFAVYRGESVVNRPPSEQQLARMPPGAAIAVFGHRPRHETHYPCAPHLARHMIEQLVAAEFDVAQSNALPQGADGGAQDGLPHALGFVLRQIMQDRPVPHIPVLINTFYPPNQPTARRCHRFGSALADAIAAWSEDLRVAVIASGGLSHFVVDEELDARFIAALGADDAG